MGITLLARSLGARARALLCAGAGLALLALGAPAAAGPLSSASFAFVLGSMPAASIGGSGATGTATSLLSASLAGGTALDGVATATTTTTGVVTAIQVVVTKNGGQTFTGSAPQAVGGDLLVEGVVRVYGAGLFPSGAPLLSVPLRIGAPETVFHQEGGVSITTVAAAWTAGTASVPLTLPSGPATMMGSNALTPGGGGTLVLVTPLLVRTNATPPVPAFGILTLSYVPEPGTLALAGLGLSMLAVGRRRSAPGSAGSGRSRVTRLSEGRHEVSMLRRMVMGLRYAWRGRLVGGLAGLALLAPPPAASAATLSSATFTYQLQGLPKKIFPGAGVTGAATSQLSAYVDGGTGFNGAITTFIPTTAAPPITAFQVIVTKNGSGSFTGVAPGQVGGTLEVGGVANVYGPGWPTLPLLSVPLQLGVPNTIVQEGGGVSITAIAAGWTVGTVSVATTFGTPTRMGSNALTPGGAGTLVLVTPQVVRTNVAGVLAAFGTLSLTYVPEPGTLLMLGLGVACVAAVGRRRM